MPATPTDILEINRPDVTVRLGWRGTPGFRDMDDMFRTGPSADAVMNGLSGVEHDPAQILKLQHFLAPAHGGGLPAMTVRYDGNHHVPHPVLRTVRHHLDSGRLQGFVAARHVRPEHRRPHGASTPAQPYVPSPSTPIQTVSPAHAAAVASALPATPGQRVEALFRASVPFMKADIRAEMQHLLTVDGLTNAAVATVGFMMVMTAAQAVPVYGVNLDAVLVALIIAYAGFSGLRAFRQLMVLSAKAAHAGNQVDIERLAPEAAKAIETLGTDFLIAFGTRFRGRRPDSAGGTPAGAAAPADAAPAARETLGTSPYPGAAKAADAAPAEDSEAAAAAKDGAGRPEGGSDCEDAASCVQTGEPVNVASGAVFTEHTDFVLPGPLPLVFARIWMSTSTVNGDLGHGWHHSLSMALLPRADGRLALRLADGRFVVMDEPSPGHPSHDGVERMQLARRDGGVVAVDHAGRIYSFGEPLGPMKMRHLAAIADGNGNAIRLERERWGGLASITDSGGRVLNVTRDELQRILSIDAPHPSGEGRLVLASFEYDRNGDLTVSRDATGAAFRQGYERHMLVRQTRPAGVTFYWRYNDTALRRRARCIHTWGDGNLYDRQISYDDQARRTTVRTGRGGVLTHHWNAQKRVIATVDALGRRSTTTYAPDGKLLLSETRADGATRREVRDGYGRLIETVDYDGVVTRRRYAGPDAEGLVSGVPLAIEAPDGSITTFEWDVRQNLAAHTDPAGRTRRFLRDARGLTLAIRDAVGTLRRFGWTEDGLLAWQAAGETGARTCFRYDALGRMTERQAGEDLPIAYRSDAVGRLLEVRRADGGVIALEYDADGNMIRHRGASGNETVWRYDGLPMPVERRDADGTGLRYGYDGDLNLIELVNQRGERFARVYDLADQLVEETGFDGRRKAYAYDEAGFLAAHTDAEDRGATYRRDPMGRLLERQHSDGLADCYGYDAAGRLVLAANGWGEIGFAYGPDGLLREERGPAGAIRFGLDARGRRVSTTLPDGRVIESGWDDADRAASVGVDGATIASFERDGLGREIGRQAGALQVDSAYDPQGRLVRQTGRVAGFGEPTIERRYAWDAADRLTELVDLERGVRRYRYDAKSRLVDVDGALPERFVFDPANAIVAISTEGDTGPGRAVGDRLLMRGDRKFEYDGCGNRVREVRGAGGGVERLYRYSADNQLAEVDERSRLGRRVTSFAYDALGRRTEKRSRVWSPEAANDTASSAGPVSDTRTVFAWSGDLLLSQGTAGDPFATVFLHEAGGFRPLAMLQRVAPDLPASVLHYHLDQLGTPQEISNDDGRCAWRAHSRAFGALARGMIAEIAQPIRFPGQYATRRPGCSTTGSATMRRRTAATCSRIRSGWTGGRTSARMSHARRRASIRSGWRRGRSARLLIPMAFSI